MARVELRWARFLLVFCLAAATYVGLVPMPVAHVAAGLALAGVVYAGWRIDVLTALQGPAGRHRRADPAEVAGWVSLAVLGVIAGELLGVGMGWW